MADRLSGGSSPFSAFGKTTPAAPAAPSLTSRPPGSPAPITTTKWDYPSDSAELGPYKYSWNKAANEAIEAFKKTSQPGSKDNGNSDAAKTDKQPSNSNDYAPGWYNADNADLWVEYYEEGPYAPGVKVQKQKTYKEVFNDYRVKAASNKEQFKALQAKLYAAGYYDSVLDKGETPDFGMFDVKTAKAITAAMDDAVLGGMPVDDVLEMRGASNTRSKKVNLVNPEQVKADAQGVARRLTGRGLDDAALQQIAANAQSFANSDQGEGNATSNWLEEQIRALRPNDVAAFQTAGNVQTFLQMLGSSAGSQGVVNAYRS